MGEPIQVPARRRADRARHDLRQVLGGNPSFEGWLVVLISQSGEASDAATAMALATTEADRRTAEDMCREALEAAGAAAAEAVQALEHATE